MRRKRPEAIMSSPNTNISKLYLIKFLLSLHLIGGVLVPFFLDWGGISFTQTMLLQSFFVLLIFVLEVPTGAVADYLGRKVSILLAALSLSLATLVYSYTPDFRVFLAGEFLWALGFALLSGADQAIVYDSLKEMEAEKESKKIFGRFNSFETAAYMISAPIGSVVAATLGLRYTMMLMAAPFFVAVIVALTIKEPERRQEKEPRRYLETVFSGIKYFNTHRILKILTFDKVSIGALTFFVVWTYQVLLKQQGVPLVYFGLIHAAMTGIQIPVMINFERLEKILGSKKRYLVGSALLTGTAFIILGINTHVPVTVVLLLVISGFGMSRQVLFQNYLNKHIESHNRATVISTVSMIETCTMGLLYPLAGLMVEWSLSSFLIIIGVGIAVCSLTARTKEEHLID